MDKVQHFIHPMLAKETDEPFDDENWLFEIKWDGYRAISEIKNGEVSLYSRNGNSFNQAYPLVYNELKKIKHNVVLDGEIVILNDEGKSDFKKLQHYSDNTQFPICYYVFDLLSLNGHETYGLTLSERKELLQKLLPPNKIIKYSEHISTKGKSFFEAAKQQDLEGIMAKKADSQYHPGARTSEWLKIKHHKSTEVIIVGFTQPAGSRNHFGALVLGVRSGDGFEYVGHTGSGFSDKGLKEMYDRLKPLIQKDSPFNEVVKTNAPVTWVKPVLVCEIKFTEWTTDRKMRHPIFLRLREDKSAKDIVMEKTTPVKPQKEKPAKEEKESNSRLIGKITVNTTHQDKVYFPGEDITKGMVIDYYQQIADYILPYLKDRPESLKRNPNGILGQGFFYKDAGDEAPDWVKSMKIFSDSVKKDIDYILCNNKQTLAYLNNLGCIELNPWHSTAKSLDKPDYLIIDIDPSEKNSFEQVIEAALAFKELMDRAGADSFCKTSGATGLHIYLPMGKKYSYEHVKDFAHLLCMNVNQQLPAFTTLERNLQKRGDKRIYLDFLQNRRSQTIASAYSLRPRAGATVSMPLEWKEVKKGLQPSDFTIHNAAARIPQVNDLFKGIFGKATDIRKCLEKLEGEEKSGNC